MWVFVIGDLVIFAAYFIIFMIYRADEPALFLASQQHLSQEIGFINTLVLLASSWFIATSVQAARSEDHKRALRLTVWGSLCGFLFILIKGYEWFSHIRLGLTLASDDFFMFYYMLTGVHLFHVVLGLVVLTVVFLELRAPRLRRASVIEMGATYWHMVDLLWIVIFSLVYVIK